MTQCKKIKKNGKQCQAHAFSDGSGICLFHSTTSQAKEARKIKPISKERMIRILQKQIRKLEKEEDTISASGEIRRNLQMIQELKNGKPSPQEEEKEPEGETMEQRLKRWKKKNTQ